MIKYPWNSLTCKSVRYLGSTESPAIKHGILNTILPSYYASHFKGAQNTASMTYAALSSPAEAYLDWEGSCYATSPTTVQRWPSPESQKRCHHNSIPVTHPVAYHLCCPSSWRKKKKKHHLSMRKVSMRHYAQPSFSTHLFTGHKVSSTYNHHCSSRLASFLGCMGRRNNNYGHTAISYSNKTQTK